jgi:hypothetical protein
LADKQRNEHCYDQRLGFHLAYHHKFLSLMG